MDWKPIKVAQLFAVEAGLTLLLLLLLAPHVMGSVVMPQPMLFPTITANGLIAQASGPTTIPIPTGVESGDLVMIFESNYGPVGEFYTCASFQLGGVVTTWRTLQIVGSERLFGCSAIASGGETSISLVKLDTNTLTFQTYRVTNWFGENDDDGMSFSAADMASPPNPPSHNPPNWDVEDTTWLVIGSLDTTGAETLTGNSAGYTFLRQDNSVDESVRSAILASATASQDPGAFTQTGGVVGASAFTIAIRPSEFSPPSVNTLPANSVAARTAVLNGNLTSDGNSNTTSVHFEWGTTVSLGTSTTPETLVSPGTFDFTLTGLSPNTQYFFRAHAENEAGTDTGAILNFTTTSTVDVSRAIDYAWVFAFITLLFLGLYGAFWIKRRRD